MVVDGWRRLAEVGVGWQWLMVVASDLLWFALVSGVWRLVVICGGWWWLVVVGSGC